MVAAHAIKRLFACRKSFCIPQLISHSFFFVVVFSLSASVSSFFTSSSQKKRMVTTRRPSATALVLLFVVAAITLFFQVESVVQYDCSTFEISLSDMSFSDEVQIIGLDNTAAGAP